MNNFERYKVSAVPEGLQVSHWQALPNVGLGVVMLLILTACFLTDPYQGHGRIWALLGVATLAFVALFGVRVESWILSDYAVRYKSSLWRREVVVELSPEEPLSARVDVKTYHLEEDQDTVTYTLQLLGPNGIELGEGFGFRKASTLDLFLKTLQRASPSMVTERPLEK